MELSVTAISLINRAQEHALRMLTTADKPESFERLRQAVKAISEAANQRRNAYRGRPKVRAMIRSTEFGAWELSQVMSEVLEQWATADVPSILVALYVGIKHIDGTPLSMKDEPSAETIDQLIAGVMKTIRTKFTPKPRLLDEIGQDLAKIVSPAARLVEPTVEPTVDPEDKLEPESRLDEPVVKPKDSFSPENFDWSVVKP